LKVQRVLKPTNPARMWARRLIYGIKQRPDVQILKLQRRIDLLEAIVDVNSRSSSWINEFIATLTPHQFPGLELQRYGSTNDGGYVLPSSLIQQVTGVVSIGVGDNNDVDFALAELGIPVVAWDHTVTALPRDHELITFNPRGVGGGHDNAELIAFDQLVAESFPDGRGDLALLIDAEGAEWPALQSCSLETLERFSVIAIEAHDLGNLILDPDPQIGVLQRLHAIFSPVAVHANNHATVWTLPGLDLPDAIEITYVRGSLFSSAGVEGNCPAHLLAPCCPDLPETRISWMPLHSAGKDHLSP
jgi:hypothetical protein